MRALIRAAALCALLAPWSAAAVVPAALDDEAVGREVERAQEALQALDQQGSHSVDPEQLRPALGIIDHALASAADPTAANALGAHMVRQLIYLHQGRLAEARAELEIVVAHDGPPKLIEKAFGSLVSAYAQDGDASALERMVVVGQRHGLDQDDLDQITKLAAAARVSPGQPFPDFTLVDTAGASHHLADYRGKVLLLDLWATWCVPCLRGLPRLKQAFAALHARGLEVLGVSLDDQASRLSAFVATEGIPWPQCCDGKAWNGELPSRLGVSSIPALFVIGPDGRLLAKDVHCEDLDLATLIDALLPKAK